MKRRTFLAALAVLPALTVLGGSALRLAPRREGLDVAMDGDFKTENLRYKMTERWSNTLSTPTELSEKVLEDMLRQLTLTGRTAFKLQPTKLLVRADMYERAHRVLAHRPGLFERLWWMLVPAP